jgi:hypothetical protein
MSNSNQDNTALDIILTRLDKIEEKLDKYQSDITALKYDYKNDIDKVNLKLETHTKQLENLEKYNNRPWKDRIIEMVTEGLLYTIGGIFAFGVVTIILSSFGSNLTILLKTFLTSALGG